MAYLSKDRQIEELQNRVAELEAELEERTFELQEEINKYKSALGLDANDQHEVKLRAQLKLPPTAIKILLALHASKGNLVTKQALVELLYTNPTESTHYEEPEVRIITVYMARIRSTMPEDSVVTSYGRGYMLSEQGIKFVDKLLKKKL